MHSLSSKKISTLFVAQVFGFKECVLFIGRILHIYYTALPFYIVQYYHIRIYSSYAIKYPGILTLDGSSEMGVHV